MRLSLSKKLSLITPKRWSTDRSCRRVNDQRDRPVVDQTHCHVGTEHPARDSHPECLQGLTETFIERLGDRSRGRGTPTGPSALAYVGIQSELRDNQSRSIEFKQRKFALKDPQSRDLVAQPGHLIVTI